MKTNLPQLKLEKNGTHQVASQQNLLISGLLDIGHAYLRECIVKY